MDGGNLSRYNVQDKPPPPPTHPPPLTPGAGSTDQSLLISKNKGPSVDPFSLESLKGGFFLQQLQYGGTMISASERALFLSSL